MAVQQITAVNTTDWEETDPNNTSLEWWAGVLEEDIAQTGGLVSLEGGDSGFWSGAFIPPPPRPLFLEETATTDGLTTCDLCTWAWKSRTFLVDTSKEPPGEFGWVLTLIIVSIISATVGAVIMITVLHCRSRMKSNETAQTQQSNTDLTSFPQTDTNKDPPCRPAPRTSVWSWLTRPASPKQLTTPTLPAENHYTHMNDAEDTIYAELNSNLGNQNSGYSDPDATTSSAPSSAYYSDLSVSAMPDRTYEVIGNNYWDGMYDTRNRLTVISENATMTSDYV